LDEDISLLLRMFNYVYVILSSFQADDGSGDVRLNVMETATGKILTGEDAPLSSQLESWLEMNPG